MLSVVMTLQKHLYTSDHYSGTSVMTTNDLGVTWTGPVAEKPLDWVHDNGVDIAVADVSAGTLQRQRGTAGRQDAVQSDRLDSV